ncbi:hypothetical protein [Methanocrinis sp.]|uniref:hypothetical protein n=1 Tax=Methanocrinis sp. TaxID=3101522 RepID=UPI003D0A1135
MLKAYKIMGIVAILLVLISVITATKEYYPFSAKNRHLYMNISTDVYGNNSLHGDDSVKVNYSMCNPDTSVFNIVGEIKIPCCFSDISDINISRGYTFDKNLNKFIYSCDLNKNDYANCSYIATISCNALDTLGEPPVCTKNHSLNTTTIDFRYWRWDYKGWHGQLNITHDSTLIIVNADPELHTTNVSIEESMLYLPPKSQNQDTLIAIKRTNEPFNVTLCINASDRENENLTYIWRYEDVTDESEDRNITELRINASNYI